MERKRQSSDGINPKIHPIVRPHPQEYAQVAYKNRTCPLPLTAESTALESFKSLQQNGHQHLMAKETLIVDVKDFEVYRSAGVGREFELVSLHNFDVKAKKLSISGILSSGQFRYFIENVPIENYSVEGYGNSDNPDTTVYVQSQNGFRDKKFDIWYRLQLPHQSYRPFYTGFMWIANLGKHVVDYLSSKYKQNAGLGHFKKKFILKLKKRWAGNSKFEAWMDRYGKTDFRLAIHAYIDYLYSQAYNLPDSDKLLGHPCWGECLKGHNPVIEEQEQSSKSTTATPYVYDCFRRMYFAQCLEAVPLHAKVQEENNRRKDLLGFSRGSYPSEKPKHNISAPLSGGSLLKAGDVVRIASDTTGPWKTGDADWLAYVMRTEPHTDDVQRLFVLWLYRPADTTISSVYYPNKKELFLSDHCNCKDAELLSKEVIRKVSVDWRPRGFQNSTNDYLIQTKYLTHDNSFVTMKDNDLQCECVKAASPHQYTFGETVYLKTQQRLDPVVFISYSGDDRKNVSVRRLIRLRNVDVNCSAHDIRGTQISENELVWTDEVRTVATTRLQRKCHVRYLPVDDLLTDRVPAPYNLGGIGDFWVISYQMRSRDDRLSLEKLSSPPPGLLQGYDSIAAPVKPLKGLSIFSGGGNLDRGLEELRAVTFKNVIDISAEACHTQLVNARHPKKINIYWGSVDDYELALHQGKDVASVARIGDIQFIAAGSPCPGFSSLQPDWKSNQSLRNASHITTLCSFLDIYRPEYAVLENVVSMTNSRSGHEEEKVFSQLIACIVGMGYQVSQFLMDSWTQGSAQRRSRIFVAITAPDLEPIRQPPQAYSHPENVKSRSLGKLACGGNFGSRDFEATPFHHNSVAATTADLPSIGSGLTQVCIPFPDHRVVYTMKYKDRALMKRIPRCPPGQGYVEAVKLGLVPTSLQKNKKEYGKAFRRINPAAQFPTITTNVNAQDNRCGDILHWDDPRTISIMEARRAQGFPDHEIIIGSMAEQWRIIGNAVDRHVSRALGLSLRHAVDCNAKNHKAASTGEEEEGPASSGQSSLEELEIERITIQSLTIERVHTKSRKTTSTVDTLQSRDSGRPRKQVLEDTVTLNTTSSVSLVPLKRESEDPDHNQRNAQPAKRTRHSGLHADYVPQRWDRVPERAAKKDPKNCTTR
jgi:DNA (cytosine-5)-methyltransferase 1